MKQTDLDTTQSLIRFLENSPTAFHAVDEIAKMLEEKGFVRLSEKDAWDIQPGGAYYVTRNMSSIIAFAVPAEPVNAFMITASHTDSPTYKLKADYETDAFGKYVKFNVEGYGGMIASSWLDRPLSVAGRLVLAKNGGITAVPVKVDRDLLLIPNVAVHQNRTINSGFQYNAAVDLMPLFGTAGQKGALKRFLAETAGCQEDEILSADLYLYSRTPAAIWGADSEFFSAPHIDNLQCAYGTLQGFFNAWEGKNGKAIAVYSSFDNEETGSATKQGAGSPFLFDVLERITASLGTDMKCALAHSFMVSADNGHAKHPNHPELSDGKNAPHLNEGVVIKSNAAQKYTTDALSAAVFAEICKKAEVPVQKFANRSDLGGGSTLGSISNTRVALNTVDIGCPQLAMHSSYETAGCADTQYLIDAIQAFYGTVITAEGDGSYRID